ncbi:type II toxin-antitoxin system RelE/ParE family toxin [Paraburkholderia sp.]|uniref:type II toxin-antitoxin system RelE/ParE family toxin n=1 Tax=Paraburkholderia sp. TaxID=1926495 RepID=UPI0025D84A44|nr:type II toxin-antitoxin system RelE/ParE family toxin [Paraburkholderia sp.]
MTAFNVEFAPEAVQQLEALEDYIAGQGSPQVAATYIDSIVEYCESLRSFPQRGVPRDDVRPGLRITHYRGSAIIAFAVIDATVYILGVFCGGQDYNAVLSVFADRR